jgi:hypothetical protein
MTRVGKGNVVALARGGKRGVVAMTTGASGKKKLHSNKNKNHYKK